MVRLHGKSISFHSIAFLVNNSFDSFGIFREWLSLCWLWIWHSLIGSQFTLLVTYLSRCSTSRVWRYLLLNLPNQLNRLKVFKPHWVLFYGSNYPALKFSAKKLICLPRADQSMSRKYTRLHVYAVGVGVPFYLVPPSPRCVAWHSTGR